MKKTRQYVVTLAGAALLLFAIPVVMGSENIVDPAAVTACAAAGPDGTCCPGTGICGLNGQNYPNHYLYLGGDKCPE